MKSKKLLAIALALCTLLSVLVLPTSAAIDDQNRYYTNVIIYTPQGTPVSVMIRTGELKTTEIAAAIAVKARYEAEGARMLSENDLHFNCFSFAFLDQDILENNYWMADPTEFVTDGSFVEIDTPVQGCVAVYCNMNRFYFILKAENADGTYTVTVMDGGDLNIVGTFILARRPRRTGLLDLSLHRQDRRGRRD